MNANIEHMFEQCARCREYQHSQPQEKELHYEIPSRPREVVGADVFMINVKNLPCIVIYHCKFPTEKKVNSLPGDDLVQMTKLIFTEYGLPKKIVSDLGTNVIPEMFKGFCRKMNIQ